MWQLRVIVPAILIILMASILPAAESVRIVSDLEGVSATFDVRSSDIGTSLDLSIPAVAVTSYELNSTAYKKLALPSGAGLAPAETAEDGLPDLPALTTMIIIPDQAGVSLSVTYSGYDDIEDFDLAPVQPAQRESNPAPMPFAIDNTVYATDAFYPGALAEASEPQIMRDVRFVQIALYPAQYNPAQRRLRIYRDLAVSLTYDGEAVNPKLISRPYLSDGFYPIYKACFANFDQVFATAEVRRGGYVIICKPNLVDSVRAVAAWKRQKGYPVRIVPTTEIHSSGNPSNIQIHSYLQYAYRDREAPPEYVMIVGDVDGAFVVNCIDKSYWHTVYCLG